MNRINKFKLSKIIFCFLCFFWGGIYGYFNRPLIPFEVVRPFITWRTYEGDLKYRKNDSFMFKQYVKRVLSYNKTLLLKNDFPYHVDAKHYILWVQDNVTHPDEYIYSHFDDKKYNIKWFENSNLKKSIPDIRHYHVFVKES